MTYKSDLHIYHKTERGTRVRAFYTREGQYVVQTSSDRPSRSADDVEEYTWDVPIGIVTRNPLTRCTERFSLLSETLKPSRGVTTAIRELAADYDRVALGDQPPASA
ncbi:hypothetical protein E3_0920 [Rhodococcus phage E3]|uniref:hypothetical protein n=1 Tax=Rhodococcus phage E3 TaxID=1007869 RepID=UPI0002C6A553|nr:hypothetical protein M176_gp097 [Rhodococcus phage E3]AEQ21006.1 hypothetical protein E3_0920 [Rhodococcus phage E3]